MTEPVVVTQAAMYALLLKIDSQLAVLASEHAGHTRALDDHEERLRRVEAEGNITRRLDGIVKRLDAQEMDLEAVQRRVWALPGVAAVAAIVAIVVAIVRPL